MTAPTFFTVVADFKSVVVDLEADVDPDPQLGPVTGKVTFTPVLANGDLILATNASPRPTMYVPAPIVARIDTDGRLKLRVEPDGDRDNYANLAAFPATGNTAKVYFAIDTQTFYRWDAGSSQYIEDYPYAQVRLLADTALLELESDLYYRVSFSEVVFNGSPGYIKGFTFQAPTSDTELNLVEVARVPGQPAVGITKIAPGAVRAEDGNLIFSFGGVDLDEPVPYLDVDVTLDAADISDGTATGRALITAANAAAARAAISASSNTGGITLNFADYGVCDGTTNDRAAFATALAALATAGGGTLLLPPKDIAITMNGQPTFDIPANTRIVGTPGATRFLLSSINDAAYVSFAGSAGDNVTFDGITFLRNTNCTGFVFYPDGHDGFHVNNCVLNGQIDIYENTFHGWVLHRVNFVAPKRNITIRNSTVTKFAYGLLHGNGAAGDIDTIVVDNCEFTTNYADDLEFNSPLGVMTNVSVSNCRFTNNQGASTFASLALGFANVQGIVVRDCYIDGTYSDAIHFEWGCSDAFIANNHIVGCATNPEDATVTDLDRASINIMARCHDIIVSGNTIDHRPNTNTNGLHAITVRNYTGGLSLAGETCVPPWRITITDNIILCGENFGGIWACDIADLTITGNRIVGDGLVTGGAWDDGNILAGIRADGTNTVITDNAVSGFRYGITGPLVEDLNGVGGISRQFADRKALGDPGTVVGNIVSDCYIGVVLVPSGRVNTSGNSMSNCVRPMVVGERENTAKPCTVTNNFAIGCTYPLEIGGKHIVVRSAGGSTVTVGSSKTINVNDTLLKLPVGTQITFSGGGVLTLTTAVTASALYTPGTPKALVGTVSVASITAGEYGTVTGLAHSTTAANNKVMTFNNADTMANVYDSDEARRKGTTKRGTGGTEDGSATWSKIASLNLSSTFYSGAAVTLAITSGVGAFETAILGLHAYSQETGQPNLVTLEMIAKSGAQSYITAESFKAVSGNYGTTVDLWMFKNAPGGIFNVYELTRHLTAGGTVTYFTDSPWQSATPTGTVSVTTQGVTAFGVPVVTSTATQTLTGKTLTSPTLTTPVLGTPSSGNLTNCTFPTLNQNTTGSAASLTTGRTVQANLGSTSSATFDGTANITPGVTGTLPVGNGGTGSTSLVTTATASSVAARDSNGNISADKFLRGFTSTATAGATTTLTITSTQVQEFTGSLAQTVALPTTSVPAGAQYQLINNSTGALTVQSSGGNTVVIMAAATESTFTALVATPTTAAHWEDTYQAGIVASGKSLTVNNSLTFSGTDGTTMTFPTTSATLARTDAANTFTGVQTMTSPSFTTPVLGTPSSGTLTNCTGLPVSGITASTSTALGVGSIEMGHATDTTLSRSSAGVLAVEGVVVDTVSATNTLTNKRITPRINSTASSATPSINTDTTDQFNITALAVAITSMTSNLSGTPTDGQKLLIRIKDNATARAITWGTSFVSSGVGTLPTTTVISKTHLIGLIYDSAAAKWVCVAADATGY